MPAHVLNRIKEYRLRQGETQQQLADAGGVSRCHIRVIREGRMTRC